MRTLVLILVSTLGVSCATPEPGRLYHPDMTPFSEAELETLRSERLQLLVRRTVEETKCESPKVKCLNSDVNQLCTTALASGCNTQVTYLWVRTDVGQSQWSADTAASSQPK